MTFGTLKDFLEHYSGLERDALHIHAALFLYVLSMAFFRQSRKSRVPWLVVFGIECANELYDLSRNFGRGPEAALAGSAKDLWNTMLWPTVLLLLGRYTTWFQRRHLPRASDAELRSGAGGIPPARAELGAGPSAPTV